MYFLGGKGRAIYVKFELKKKNRRCVYVYIERKKNTRKGNQVRKIERKVNK
jgi:hypothetical protein